MINPHRRWLYKKGEDPRIFDKGEEIPTGWYDSPAFSDSRTEKLWDGPHIEEDSEPDTIPNSTEPETIKPMTGKYPSQMNKSELLEHGKLLGIEFGDGMTKREMRAAINDKVLESGDGTE